MEPKVRIGTAKSEVRAAVSKALAEALITGIDQAAQENHELTQLQQINLATMTIMSYATAIDACENLELCARLENG